MGRGVQKRKQEVTKVVALEKMAKIHYVCPVPLIVGEV